MCDSRMAVIEVCADLGNALKEMMVRDLPAARTRLRAGDQVDGAGDQVESWGLG